MSTFRDGDVVRLKSGGPAMTVECPYTFHDNGDRGYRCMWFVGDNRRRDEFRAQTIELVEQPAHPYRTGAR